MTDQQPQAPATPVGTQEQRNDIATSQNPYAEVDATPDEQAEYVQFVSRFLTFISDRDGGDKSTAAQTMKMLNNASLTAAEAIGRTTASVAFIIVHAAQVHKIKYQTDVLFHACFECVAAVYVMGLAANIFKNAPKYKGLDKDGGYPFDHDDLKIVVHAQFQAVRAFGNMEVKNGMMSPEVKQQNMQFWNEQIEREVKSGKVNNDVMNKLAKSGLFNGAQAQMQRNAQPQPQGQPQSPQQGQSPSPQQLAMAPNPAQQPPQQASGQPAQNATQLPP